MDFTYKKIGNILCEKKLISKEQAFLISKSQHKTGELFGYAGVDLGFLAEQDLVEVLSEIYCIDTINLEFLYIDRQTLFSIDYDTAKLCCAIPFYIDYKKVKIAIADPGDIKSVDLLRSFFKNLHVELFIAKKTEIQYFIEILNGETREVYDNPLLLLNKIIFDSIDKKASDIHFEAAEGFVHVRLRIDGVLKYSMSIDFEAWQRIQSKLKLMSGLNITENRRPQSGHSRIQIGGKTVDLRISTHPGIHGENFVIRVFDLSDGVKKLSDLGFENEDCLWLKNVISQPNGIFLIIGPTGSGKTTTMYSLIKELNSSELNIMTLEDPVEYHINGVRQLDLRDEGMLTYANGIKSILRQDPDVILIGEIRDEATAYGAIRASLTGRLVLATLHASTPVECLRRLLDFGLKLSDFIPLLIGVFSQRLVRRLKDGEYNGRFPIAEYVYFSKELKNNLLWHGRIDECVPDKSFWDSSRQAIDLGKTDLSEIKRALGNGDI